MKTKLTKLEREACDILIEEMLTKIIINDLDIHGKTNRYNDYSGLFARRACQLGYLIFQKRNIGVTPTEIELEEFLESQYIVDELQTNWNRYMHSLN